MARESVVRKLRAQLAVALVCVASFALQAETGSKTNEAVISYIPPSITLESSERSDVLMDRFLQEAISADSIVFDRFVGPAAQLAWQRRQDTLGYESIDRANAYGAKMFTTIGLDSLRTAAIAALPLDLWEEHWQGWFAKLITGTIGNPQEEHVEMTSISYSAVRTSWESFNERGSIQWGFRPWRTSPYLYFLAHAGRLDGRPLITFESRAGYSLFGSTKIESRLTLQLPGEFRIAGGVAIDPGRMESHDSGATHFAVTLERLIRVGGLRPDALFYVGLRSGTNRALEHARHENLIVAGLLKRW